MYLQGSLARLILVLACLPSPPNLNFQRSTSARDHCLLDLDAASCAKRERRLTMAEKPTIYKFKIALSDLDRDVYETLNLTFARHPSETLERMTVRMLAFCFNAQDRLVICKGLSDTEEPGLWAHSLDGNLELSIEVGEPAFDRIKKATRVAKEVKLYCFNSKADTWWELNRNDFGKLSAQIFQFQWDEIVALANKVDRTMDISITITDSSAYVATAKGECEVTLQQLQ